MARKKTDIDNAEQVVESNVQEVDSNVQGVGDNSSVETSAYSNEENEDKSIVKPQRAKTGIPVAVDKLLKVYNNYEQLYIDAKGSVYTADTQPNLVGNAILYQNPYYQS